MGSPLSPVIANLFTDNLEKKAINTSQLQPSLWISYVVDCFAIWPHIKDILTAFLTHKKNINSKIAFAIETETDNDIPFLDLFIKKKKTVTLTTYGHNTFTPTLEPSHGNYHKGS